MSIFKVQKKRKDNPIYMVPSKFKYMNEGYNDYIIFISEGNDNNFYEPFTGIFFDYWSDRLHYPGKEYIYKIDKNGVKIKFPGTARNARTEYIEQNNYQWVSAYSVLVDYLSKDSEYMRKKVKAEMARRFEEEYKTYISKQEIEEFYNDLMKNGPIEDELTKKLNYVKSTYYN